MAHDGIPSGRKSRVKSPRYPKRMKTSKDDVIRRMAENIMASSEYKSMWPADDEMTDDDQVLLAELIKRDNPSMSVEKVWEIVGIIFSMQNSNREIEGGEAKRWGIGVKDKPFTKIEEPRMKSLIDYEAWLKRTEQIGMRDPKNPQRTLSPEHPLTRLRIKELKTNIDYERGKIPLEEFQDRITLIDSEKEKLIKRGLP